MVYDVLNVNVIISNTVITGYAEGTMVSCNRNNDLATPYVGVKGEGAFSINNDNSGTITISLQQGSPANAFLQTLANNKASFPISVIDNNTEGKFRAGGNEAYILTEPTIERGAEITTNNWDIYVSDYTLVQS